MARTGNYVPRIAIFLAGVAAGVLSSPRRARTGADPQTVADLKRSVEQLQTRLAAQETATANRLSQIDSRLDEQATRLADVPSTAQIVAAMEQLLSKTMTSLDERLTAQAHSINVLKTTVSQTDSLLERVLESLDSLQSYSETAELADHPLMPKSRA